MFAFFIGFFVFSFPWLSCLFLSVFHDFIKYASVFNLFGGIFIDMTSYYKLQLDVQQVENENNMEKVR